MKSEKKNMSKQKIESAEQQIDLFKTWLVETPIAHRGLHGKNVPENSLAAFSKAIEKGYAIEFDVHLLADGTIAVFHDSSLARMTGNDGYLKYLNEEDLKALHLAGTKETIPTFDEVLELIDGKVPILIEIKNQYKVGKLEQAIINRLKTYKGKFAVQSFNPYSLAYFKKHSPNIIRGQLSGTFKGEGFEDLKMSKIVRYVLKHMMLNKSVSEPHFIAYQNTALPNRIVKKYKNLPLLAWVVESKKEYLRVVKYCDNIIFQGFEPEI